MRHFHLAGLLLLFTGTLLVGAELRLGVPRDAVIAELGQPKAYIESGQYELLYYDRGKVEIKGGVVTFIDLMTEEALEAWKRQEALELEARARAAAERKARLIREGQAERSRLMSDPRFLEASAARRVVVWREFVRRYPDVPPTEDYALSLQAYNRQLEQQHMEQRVEELEQRVREAEAKATIAEIEAARANQRRQSTVVYGYPLVVPARTYTSCKPRHYGAPATTHHAAGLSVYYKHPAKHLSSTAVGAHYSSYRYGPSHASYSRYGCSPKTRFSGRYAIRPTLSVHF